MARLELAPSGKSLTRAEGLAGLRPSDVAYIVRRGSLTLVAIGALIAGLATSAAAIQGVAYAGVVSDLPGGLIVAVEPTGYAWRAGLRPGQRVVLLSRADDPGGSQIVAIQGDVRFRMVAAHWDAQLKAAAPLGLIALALGCLALLFLRARRRWVLPTASAALLVASVPALVEGLPDVSTAVLGAAALVPAASFTLRIPGGRWIRAATTAALGGFVVVWAVARLMGVDASGALETARGTIALWATLGLAVERVVLPTLAGERLPVMRPRFLDVGFVAAFAAVALVLVVLQTPPLVIGALLLLVVIFVPSTRRRLGRGLEDALLGDVREAAAAEGAEQERARLARELHDVPLQELVGVIRRLEVLPGAEAESENLRALAGHLRNVATELRPPVLDDLGLPAAIDYLAEESATPALPVVAEIVDDTGFGPDRRPPAEVELAMYRIASEAVGNAVRHSRGTTVRVSGAVAPDRVELVVSDDGAGLEDEATRAASRRKRLGLASMRRRAQAIDAELWIDGSTRGTEIRVVWQA